MINIRPVKRRRYQRKRHWLLLSVCVAALGIGGWLTWRWFQAPETVTSSTGSGKIYQAMPLLKIPDWGVALQLDQATADTTAELIGTNFQYVALSNSRLTTIARTYPECNNVNTAVKLIRAKPGDVVYGERVGEQQLKANGLKLGDYYYYTYRGVSCSVVVDGVNLKPEVDAIQSRLSELYITTIPR